MSESGKKPVGRPSKYKPEYCEQLIEHMSNGYSFESFAADLSVSKDTLYEWSKVYPEFSDAHAVGRMKLLKHLETFTIMAVGDTETYKINTGLHIFRLKNQIGWKEKSEQEIQGKVTLEDLVSKSRDDGNK